jgi:hypothetical protein
MDQDVLEIGHRDPIGQRTREPDKILTQPRTDHPVRMLDGPSQTHRIVRVDGPIDRAVKRDKIGCASHGGGFVTDVSHVMNLP